MNKESKESGSVQKPTRIPLSLWKRIESAMEYEGVRTFAQFNLSALTHHVRTIEERKAKSESARK